MKTETSIVRATLPNTMAGRSRTACTAGRLPLLLLLLVPAAVHAQYDYTTNDGTITITGYSGEGGAITIPGTIDDLPVTAIGDWAFNGNTSLTSVIIPDNVTRIGDHAFSDCTALTSVTIPASVASIGNCAFCKCSNLAVISLDPNNASFCCVDGVLFNKTQSMLIQYPAARAGSTYTIPGGVARVEDGSFSNCRLIGVTIPPGVTRLGQEAFTGAMSLTSVALPSSVNDMGDYTFYNCGGLTQITVDPNNPSFCSVDGVLFNKSQSDLVKYPAARAGSSYTVPNGVTHIWSGAFNWCRLTSLTFPNSVTDMGDWTCHDSANLASVTFSNRLNRIPDWSFDSCPLTSVTIPGSVTRIGGGAFNSCPLTSITLPNNLTSIGGWSFANCLLTSITIPNHVTDIADGAFGSCPLTSLTIPDSVATIGNWTFSSCPLTSLTLGAGLVSLGDGAFNSCTGLTRVTIPDSVVRIGGWSAFGGCTGLTSVTIGTGVMSLGDAAFGGCTSLLGIYFKGNAPSPGGSVFDGDNKATVYYTPGTTGWDTTFGGRPTAPWLASNISGTLVPVGYIGDISALGAKIGLMQGGVTVLTEKVFLDANGRFTVSNVVPGTYDIAVTIGGWLKRVKDNVTMTDADTDIGILYLQGADSNGDNVVSFEDFAILQNDYNHSGASGADPLSAAAANSATGGCGALGIVLVSLIGFFSHAIGFRRDD